MRSWWRRRWKFLLAFFVGLELFVTLAGCADSFLLFPSTDPRDAMGATKRFIQLDGRQVEIWTIRSKACDGQEPKAYVLAFTGNGSRAEDETWYVAERWRSWPVEVWGMNYPGYGGSTGPAKLKWIPPSALATYDALRTVAGDRPIFIEANSLGTTSAIYLAGVRPTPGIILQNPPPLRRLIMQKYGWWNLWMVATPVALQVPTEMNTTSTGPSAKVPACFLLADEDEVIPPNYHDIVVNAYAGPKTIINLPFATHNSPVDGPSEHKLHDWIRQLWNQTFPTTQPAQ